MENTYMMFDDRAPPPSADIAETVRQIFINQLQKGFVPWHKPWTVHESCIPANPRNIRTNHNYNGINKFLLWMAAVNNNYLSTHWGSETDWEAIGECVGYQQRPNLVTYYDTVEEDIAGELTEITTMKTAFVFNRCQLVNQEPIAYEKLSHWTLADNIERMIPFFYHTSANLFYHTGDPDYDPVMDIIYLPEKRDMAWVSGENFTLSELHFSNLWKQVIRWTGHPSRLNRPTFKNGAHDDPLFEELVGEMGGAMLSGDFQIATDNLNNDQAYKDYWLEQFTSNKVCIISAAKKAFDAVFWLHTIQPM